MRFNENEVYKCTTDGRTAVVVGVRENGRKGLLRFTDTASEEAFLWAELHQAGKWQRQ